MARTFSRSCIRSRADRAAREPAISPDFITGLGGPSGLASSGNTLFVANQGSGTVDEYDATTGATINVPFITGLSFPFDVAVKSAK